MLDPKGKELLKKIYDLKSKISLVPSVFRKQAVDLIDEMINWMEKQ